MNFGAQPRKKHFNTLSFGWLGDDIVPRRKFPFCLVPQQQRLKEGWNTIFFFGDEGISTEIESFFMMSNDKALKILLIKLIDPWRIILSFKKLSEILNAHEHVWLKYQTDAGSILHT